MVLVEKRRQGMTGALPRLLVQLAGRLFPLVLAPALLTVEVGLRATSAEMHEVGVGRAAATLDEEVATREERARWH